MSEDLNPEEYFDFLINVGVIFDIMDCVDEAKHYWELAVELR